MNDDMDIWDRYLASVDDVYPDSYFFENESQEEESQEEESQEEVSQEEESQEEESQEEESHETETTIEFQFNDLPVDTNLNNLGLFGLSLLLIILGLVLIFAEVVKNE